MSLQIIPVKISEDVHTGDNIIEKIISSNKSSIDNGDVIVISQKIISKHEGRVVELNSVIPSELAVGIASAYDKDPKLVEVILSESKRIVRMKHGVIIVETKHNFICANAGIDESNVENRYATLLPTDPDKSAKIIELLKEINAKGTTILIATHDYLIIKKYQARTIKCADQKVIEVDTQTL